MHAPLEPGGYYHIYNRGINRQPIFFEPDNYRYFLDKYRQHVTPVADTFAYCLLSNHFHFLVQIKPTAVLEPLLQQKDAKKEKPLRSIHDFVSDQFSNFFNAYTKAVNKRYGRDSALFRRPFRRILITEERHLVEVVRYIHRNPEKHGIIPHFEEWEHHSYAPFLNDSDTWLAKDSLLEWFCTLDNFIDFHQTPSEEDLLDFKT
ncbi:MAG: transposase [Saprospiraceae bacterium]